MSELKIAFNSFAGDLNSGAIERSVGFGGPTINLDLKPTGPAPSAPGMGQ
jgi:hypothetical protein